MEGCATRVLVLFGDRDAVVVALPRRGLSRARSRQRALAGGGRLGALNEGRVHAGPQPLGRNLSSGNVTVNLLTPQTVFAERRNNLDFRISKVVRYGRTRTQVGVDLYNALNADVVTTFNQGFVPGGSWLTPTAM